MIQNQIKPGSVPQIKQRFSRWLDSLSHLVYPHTCISCSGELSVNEQWICSFCQEKLSTTNFHLYDEPSPMDKLFWGRIDIRATYAHFYFKKKNPVQRILFQLKYKNGFKLGVYYGKLIGTCLKQNKHFGDADLLIPIPLHYKRQFKRGYNQSEQLAKGIARTYSGLRVDTSLITRSANTATQTKKNRFQRWDNVQGIFVISDELANFRHIVLVDDVITTGSTIETLAQAIRQKHPQVAISVVTLAIA